MACDASCCAETGGRTRALRSEVRLPDGRFPLSSTRQLHEPSTDSRVCYRPLF